MVAAVGDRSRVFVRLSRVGGKTVVRNRLICIAVLSSFVAASSLQGQDDVHSTPDEAENETETSEPIIVSATRVEIRLDQSPATVSVIDAQDLEIKQIERVAEALREVPGLSVVETGAPGQLTSVFTRGLNSAHTQVLLDGIPINQGLSGAMNFADLTTDNIERIEVVRGPQSTLYGPSAAAGVIQIFTRQGEGRPTGSFSFDGGSFDTFRETFQSQGRIQQLDYSFGASRIDTDNDRPNNQYRSTAAIANIGWSPSAKLRIGGLFTYSNSDAGNPNKISDPHPFDNLLTERWLISPNIDFKVGDWWEHKLIVSYDHERQVNNPNFDGFFPGTTFVGPTRALFERFTIDYQNDLKPTSWLTLTSGVFYSDVDSDQERPFASQDFGPQPTFISDHTEQTGLFAQATVTPITNLVFVAGGRWDHFNQFGDIGTYRVAASYEIDRTNTMLHSSVATGFSPPSSQDKIFRSNINDVLNPEEVFGWDAGVEQWFWEKRASLGVTYFYNDLSNVIGFDGLFNTFNLGAARTQGVEVEFHATPMPNLILSGAYTYLDTEKTSSADVGAPEGSRLPRRPRNEVYASVSYLWWHKLRTTLSAKWVNAREEINPNFFGPNVDIEDYTLVNFAAEYEINSHFSIFGRIDNLTNEQYEEVFGFPNLGRAAYGGIKARF